MVIFEATLSDNTKFKGTNDDGRWHELRQLIEKSDLKIVGLQIYNDQGVGTIDNNCDGYFFGNKVISIFPLGTEILLIGIGYWKKHDDQARILWHKTDTMEVLFSEARPLEKCGFFLIKNNNDKQLGNTTL